MRRGELCNYGVLYGVLRSSSPQPLQKLNRDPVIPPVLRVAYVPPSSERLLLLPVHKQAQGGTVGQVKDQRRHGDQGSYGQPEQAPAEERENR
jgi:hypothetical protein